MMKKIRHYLLAGLIILLWGPALYAQTAPPNNGSTDCGQTLDFDGVDEYVAVPYSAATNPGTISVSLWVHVKAFTGEFQSVAASRNSGPLSGWTLYITPENKFSLMAGVEGNAWDGVTTTDVVQLNTWTHVAFTISGTEAVLYVNGTSLSKTMSGNHVVNGGAEMRIGAGVTEETPAKAFLNGQVDEFTLWNRTLSASEVTNLHTGTDIGTTGLVAYYNFNAEFGNATLIDGSGNGHTGTLHNVEANEDWLQTDGSLLASLWYADLDGDGYAREVYACTSPGAGYSESLGELLESDCDDTHAGINPGKTEVMSNGIDDDCNPATFDMRPFVTTWKTDNYGTSGSNQIAIPTTGSGYDYTVYWESTTDANVNGTVTGLTESATITFPKAGTYRVKIAGNFPRIYFNGGDSRKIMSIEQWGDIAWTSMERAFQQCNNLTSTATDAPNLSGVTNMSYMFYNAQNFNGDLNNWDVSSVTNMSYMFNYANKFNGNVSAWDVSSVTDMSSMFYNAYAFNGDLSAWDVSSVTNMSYMFYYASNFNGSVSAWDVSSVTDMSSMFSQTYAFNGDISAWNVSNVTNMSSMFSRAYAFDGDPSAWDVSSVTNMSYMFYYARSFNGDLSNWDISSATSMSGMLNQSGMSAAHYDATLAGWATLGETETKIPTGISLGSSGLNYCNAANRNILATGYGWTITGDTDISGLSGEPTADKLPAIISTDAVQSLVAPQAVNYCTGDTLTAVTDATLPIAATTTITWTYADGNEGTEDITQQQHIFVGRPFVFTWKGDYAYLDGNSDYDYSYVIDWGDGAIDTLQSDGPEHTYATEGPHTISVYGQFPAIELGDEESGLRSVEQWGDIEWLTMRYMFAYTSPVFNATDVPNLSQVTNMSHMFYSSGFNGDISNWDVSSVTNMQQMFQNATAFNGDLNTWDVSNVTNMSYMFQNATAFNGDLAGWDISSVTNMSNMLSQSGMSAAHYDATLVGWATLGENETKIPTGISLGASGLNYCNAANRDLLVTTYTWSISGDTDISGTSGEPMVKKLPPVTGEEAVASLVAPLAINCAGDTLTAVTDAALPITASTTITWTYVDGNEETIDATQQQYIFVGRPFVFTWEGDEAYLEGNYGYDYSYVVDWGDETIDTLQTAYLEHMYATEGPHTISVYGQFPGIALGEESGLRSIEQWGDIEWRTMRNMFAHTSPLFNTSDVPNLSQVTDMSNMFYYAGFNGDLSAWDVSNVTNMSYMFRNATVFNGDLSNWDVSNVTNMSYMFRNATAFNSDLSSWNVSSVTGMSNMLSYSGMSAANYDATLAGWATLGENETKIPTFIYLGADGLNYCDEVNRNILATDYGWSITGDTNISGLSGEPMADKLPAITSEEQVTNLEAPLAINCAGDTLTAVADVALPITASTTITWTYADGNEATEDITQQQDVFVGRPFVFTCETGDIGPERGNWIIIQPHFDFIEQTNVMIDWGDGATSHYDGSDPYNGYEFDLHDYADQGVYTISIYGDLHGITTDFTYGGEEYLAPYLRSIEQWGDIEWKTMEEAFMGTDSLQINATDAPNLSQATSMNGMFGNAARFNADLSAWDVSNVTDMSEMFYNASAFNGDLSNWDVSNVTDMSGMLSNSGMSIRQYDATLKGWATLGENETKIPAGVALGADGISYCDATGHDILVNDYGWNITDAGSYCPAPPVLAALEDKTVIEHETLSFTVEATAGELPFEYKLDAASLGKGMTLNHTTGVFSWTPTKAQIGEHSVIVMLDDTQSPLVSDTFTITVNAVNGALVISINKGLTLIQGDAAEISSELLSVTDTDNTPTELVYTVTDLPANGTLKKGETALAEHSSFTQADIDNGLISYAHDGFNGATDEFIFTVTDGSTTLTSTFAISINIVMAAGHNSIDEVSLSPVPAEDVVTLRITNAYRGNVSVQLFDENGREMLTVYTVKDRAELVHAINITSIPSGVMLLRVKTGNRTQILRMIKK